MLTEDSFEDTTPVTWSDGDILGSIVQNVNAETPTGGSGYVLGSRSTNTITPEMLFCNSMIARKAVTVIPDQALPLFKGWTQRKTKDDEFEQGAYDWFMDNIYMPLLDACYMARKHGDAYVLLFFEDGNPIDQPLQIEKITDFYGAVAKSNTQVRAIDGFKAEEAQVFSVTYTAFEEEVLSSRRKSRRQTERIHRSRLLHIPGLLLTSSIKDYTNGENASVLGYIDRVLQEWTEGNTSGVEMLKSHSAYILGIKGLAVSVRTKNVGLLTDRFKSMLQGLRGLKALLFDADKESASVVNRTYSGISSLIAQLDASLANCVDFPKSYLINGDGSPFDASGLGARYEMSQIIDRYYLSHLRKPLRRLFVLYCAWQKKSDRAENFDIEVVSSLNLTREEEARVRFKNAQTDSLMLTRQSPEDPNSAVLSVESIRTRWESGKYSDDITFIKPKAVPMVPLETVQAEATAAVDKPKDKGIDITKVAQTMTSKQGRSAYNGQDISK